MSFRFSRPAAALLLLLVLATSASFARGSYSHTGQPRSLQRLWTRSISPNADSAAASLPHVGRSRIPVVFVLAGNNTANCDPGNPVRTATLSALNAATGAVLWHRSSSGPSRCTTAGPVVDPSGRWVYAPGLDGKVHRYDAATGAESTSNGWPHTVTLMPEVEKISATLRITGRYLYVATSGYIGDQGHYEGHLVTIDLPSGKTRVFNTLCSNIHSLLGPRPGAANYCGSVLSALFGRGEAVTDPVTHDVYIVTGNGPWNGSTNWGDSVLKLDPSGSTLLDAFTPTNQQSLASSDADLGSTGPALLPTVSGNGRSYHLLVQGGKGPACDGCSGTALRLLNRDNLSGHGGPGHLGGDLQDLQAPGGCEVLTAPAVWTSPSHRIWVFYANGCGLAGYRLSTSLPFRLTRVWSVARGGSTPLMKNGILWVARGGEIAGYAPATGQQLWSGAIGGVHWEYPHIAQGRVFITDEGGKVTAFRLPAR